MWIYIYTYRLQILQSLVIKRSCRMWEGLRSILSFFSFVACLVFVYVFSLFCTLTENMTCGMVFVYVYLFLCMCSIIFAQLDSTHSLLRIQSITAGVTAAQGFFSSLLFGSTPIVIRSWGKFSFAWLTREYLPQLWSKIRIIGSPRIDNDDGDDHIYTAAGLWKESTN